MKQYLPVNTTIIGSIFLSLLMGGCALQPTKSRVPAQLEKEIKTIEGQRPTTYQPSISSKSSPSLRKGGFAGEKTTYTVKKGDTLWGISKKHGVSADTIRKTNHITNTKDLKVGQKLIIPASGKSYASPATHSSYTPASNITGGISSKGFIWPVKGQVVSQFGEMRKGVKNMGIYILPQPGQKLVAAKKGTVEAVTDADDGTHVIVIKHDGGCRTIYGCRSNPTVGEGSYVEQGQPIASISQTNTGNPSEFNFKIYVKDKPVNPLSYLP
ncbi:MAG: LysM protein [Candidatus Brocadiaceae bacterium]|nr:LysM protein [Candidatus Brocadiaceae bacterium]